MDCSCARKAWMKLRAWWNAFMWRMVKRWAVHREDAAFIFTRADGIKADVDCCACNRCKNYFWVQHTDVERPSYCPYCGSKFTGVVPVTNDEINGLQML